MVSIHSSLASSHRNKYLDKAAKYLENSKTFREHAHHGVKHVQSHYDVSQPESFTFTWIIKNSIYFVIDIAYLMHYYLVFFPIYLFSFLTVKVLLAGILYGLSFLFLPLFAMIDPITNILELIFRYLLYNDLLLRSVQHILQEKPFLSDVYSIVNSDQTFVLKFVYLAKDIFHHATDSFVTVIKFFSSIPEDIRFFYNNPSNITTFTSILSYETLERIQTVLCLPIDVLVIAFRAAPLLANLIPELNVWISNLKLNFNFSSIFASLSSLSIMSLLTTINSKTGST